LRPDRRSTAARETLPARFDQLRDALAGWSRRRGSADHSAAPWADNRAIAQAERLRAEHPELLARTGTPLHPISPLPKLVWFRETQPELFSGVRPWAGVKELIVRRLTGEWVIDVSCATGTGLLSLDRLWDAQALAVADVGVDELSRVVSARRRSGSRPTNSVFRRARRWSSALVTARSRPRRGVRR
jgi:sugar (pentulose or hexulose) kinase